MPREEQRTGETLQATDAPVKKTLLSTVYFCFFLSGAAGLIYEIVWMRLLTLSFGSMVFAVGAVLSSFMAGLALGNFFLGRAADAWRRPLIGYAILEAGTGISALLVPPLLRLADRVSIMHGAGAAPFLGQAFLTFTLSFMVLMIPTVLMGGTLPALSRSLVRRESEVGGRVGVLYGLNTLGGAAGVVLAGMLLIQKIGLRNTTLLAVALNILVSVVVCIFAFAIRVPVSVGPRVQEGAPSGPVHAPRTVLAVAIALSGLTAMVYEVSWTRSLALVIGSSIYAFNTMLLSFIFGIGLGSLIFAAIFRRRAPGMAAFAYVELLIGICCFMVVLSFDRLPSLFLRMYAALAPAPGHLFLGELLICFLVMLFPTVLFGTTLPMIGHIFAGRHKTVGKSIGTVYAANTAGCIVGSVAASFLLIPILGVQHTLKLAVALNVVIAILVFLFTRRSRMDKYVFSTSAVALTALIFAAPKEWNRNVMSMGVAPNAVWLDKLTKLGSLEDIASVPELLYYKDGLNSTVAVHRDQKDISMSIDGKTDASAKGDLPTELLVGYLPLFLHSQPETVMVLGLGSGISLAATVSFGVDYSECLEIEPAVVTASRHFSPANRNVLEKANAKVILADGRHFLLRSKRLYDVITSEPSNPWMAGISNLFTREFYEICARRLKPDGIICQFIHGYNLTEEDFRMVMATFSSVFPHKQLWSSAFGIDYLMIGSGSGIQIDLDRIERKMKLDEVLSDLEKIGITTITDFMAHFLLEDEAWDALVQGASINTDDFPILEFSAPKSLYLPLDILHSRLGKEIHTLRIRAQPRVRWTRRDKARIHVRRGDLFFIHDFFGSAISEYEKAASLEPDWYRPYLSRAGVYETMARRGLTVLPAEMRRDLDTALKLNPNSAEVYEKMAFLACLEQKPGVSASYLKMAIAIEPKESYYQELIDILVDDLGDYEQADGYVLDALSRYDSSAKLLQKKGFISELAGDYRTAVSSYRKAREKDPYGSASYRLGRILLNLGLPEQAVEPLEQAVKVGPTFAQTHLSLAKAYAGSGMKRKAVREFKKALRIDASSRDALEGLEALR
ncbi:MAG: fused MFS/spermidine synthase [bacterium]